MIYKFTNKAKKVIEIADDISIELGHNYIGTEHILYGLVKEGEGIAAKVLRNKGITNAFTINVSTITNNKPMMCGIFAIIDSGPEIIVQLNQGSLAKPDKHTKNNNQP